VALSAHRAFERCPRRETDRCTHASRRPGRVQVPNTSLRRQRTCAHRAPQRACSRRAVLDDVLCSVPSRQGLWNCTRFSTVASSPSRTAIPQYGQSFVSLGFSSVVGMAVNRSVDGFVDVSRIAVRISTRDQALAERPQPTVIVRSPPRPALDRQSDTQANPIGSSWILKVNLGGSAVGSSSPVGS